MLLKQSVSKKKTSIARDYVDSHFDFFYFLEYQTWAEIYRAKCKTKLASSSQCSRFERMDPLQLDIDDNQ